MKMKSLLSVVAVAAMGFTAVAADHTPLEDQMAAINKSLRSIKRSLGDASKKEANLELVKKAQAAVEKAATLEPKKTKDQSDKAAYLAKYQERMKEVGASLKELETAIKAGNEEEAKKVLSKLSDQKEKGHTDFEVE